MAFLAILALGIGSPALNQAVKINFVVEGLNAQKVKIIGMIGTNNFLVDSFFTDSSGSKIFTQDKEMPGGLYYFVFEESRFFQFLLDKDQEFSMTTRKDDLVSSMVVTGSQDNDLFYQNLKFEEKFKTDLDRKEAEIAGSMVNSKQRKKLEAQKDSLIQSRVDHIRSFKTNYPESFFTVFKIAGQNPDLNYPKKPDGSLDTAAQVYQYRQDYWNGVDLQDERLLRTPVLSNKLKTYITKITDQKPDSVIKSAEYVISRCRNNKEIFKFVLNWVALEYQKPAIMGMDAVFVHFILKYWTPEIAFWSNQEEIKNLRRDAGFREVSMLGKTGQDIICTGLDGTPRRLYDLPGPVRILYMWSYTCSHCKERSPVLREVFDQWNAKGLQVYSLCLDDDETKWKATVAEYRMEPYTNVIDPKYSSGYYKKFHVDVTPELYVFDKDWKIVSKDLHPNQIGSTLEELLGITRENK